MWPSVTGKASASATAWSISATVLAVMCGPQNQERYGRRRRKRVRYAGLGSFAWRRNVLREEQTPDQGLRVRGLAYSACSVGRGWAAGTRARLQASSCWPLPRRWHLRDAEARRLPLRLPSRPYRLEPRPQPQRGSHVRRFRNRRRGRGPHYIALPPVRLRGTCSQAFTTRIGCVFWRAVAACPEPSQRCVMRKTAMYI